MGRGCAKEAARRWPDIPSMLGSHINRFGNRVAMLKHVHLGEILYNPNVLITSFPVKPIREPCAIEATNVVPHMRNKFKFGDSVPGWACMARYDIIERSAKELVEVANEFDWRHIVIPRPGAGAGGLAWSDVKSILSPILDDRFYAITFPRRSK